MTTKLTPPSTLPLELMRPPGEAECDVWFWLREWVDGEHTLLYTQAAGFTLAYPPRGWRFKMVARPVGAVDQGIMFRPTSESEGPQSYPGFKLYGLGTWKAMPGESVPVRSLRTVRYRLPLADAAHVVNRLATFDRFEPRFEAHRLNRSAADRMAAAIARVADPRDADDIRAVTPDLLRDVMTARATLLIVDDPVQPPPGPRVA